MHHGIVKSKNHYEKKGKILTHSIPENKQLTIKRKLSFSNSDLNDPTQLNFLYAKCREQVLNGIHPVSRYNAIKLAAVQCFIDFGAYHSGIERSIRYF